MKKAAALIMIAAAIGIWFLPKRAEIPGDLTTSPTIRILINSLTTFAGITGALNLLGYDKREKK
jgi:hypothetical protein